MSALKDRFVPTLDGEVLAVVEGGFLRADGTPLAPERAGDVVWVNREHAIDEGEPSPVEAWWRGLEGAVEETPWPAAPLRDVEVGELRLSRADVAEMLVTLADAHAPLPIELSAGFFHRTLLRWMRLEAADASEPAVKWDYDFWKTELVEERDVDAGVPEASEGCRVRVFSAVAHRGEGSGPERYRYWVEMDAEGAITRSGWLSKPPDLLADERREGRFAPARVDPARLDQALRADEG